MTVEVIPVPGMPEVRPGDDLAALLVRAIRSSGLALADGDVLVVTQKVVSKAEGRIVPEGREGKAEWVTQEARRIVAKRDDLVIAETRHGFVCANAGVDASNVAEGFLTLLPVDPDGSARSIRLAVVRATGADIAVIVTDTFGRAWRRGLVNVAIGCAGLPALVDLRGTKDAAGRVLQATVVALADEVAAASGLAMGKAERIPAAIVRGVKAEGPPLPAGEMVRPAGEDLFRESPLRTIQAARPASTFGRGEVPRAVLEEGVRAALAAVEDPASRSWLFLVLRSDAVRRRLLAALGRSAEPLLGEAPSVIVPCVGRGRAGERTHDHEISPGATVRSLVLALRAQGLAFRWVSSPEFETPEAREVLGLDEGWMPLGAVAAGPPGDEQLSPESPFDPSDVIEER